MQQSHENIALLIDADNAPASKIDLILSELAKHGVANIRRAYGNWKTRNIKGWEQVLHEYAIQPIQQFDYTKGKNASDMAMIIDAMDLLYTKNLDAFSIVSSDSDFTPLVMRILSNGLKVYGFGEEKTPSPFVNSCSRFLYVNKLGEPDDLVPEDTKAKPIAKDLKGDTRLLNLLRNAIEAAEDDDGWSYLGNIGGHISNQASFDPRNYGFKRIGELFKAIDLFEIQMRNNNSEMYIRDRRKSKQPAKPSARKS